MKRGARPAPTNKRPDKMKGQEQTMSNETKAKDAVHASAEYANGSKPAEGTAEAAPVEKKLSPKNKISRGVDPNMITTYVDLNMTKEQNEIVRGAAKQRGCKVTDVLRPVLEKALESAWADIEADAKAWVENGGANDKSPLKKLETATAEEAQAIVAKVQKQADAAVARAQAAAAKAKEMLAKARGESA